MRLARDSADARAALPGRPRDVAAWSIASAAALAFVCSLVFEQWAMPADRTAWLALLGLGLGPVGAAFLLWDVGMKGGSVPLLGVSLRLAHHLHRAPRGAGLRERRLVARHCVRADGGRRQHD